MAGARRGRAGRDEDEVGQGGGVAEECQGRGGEARRGRGEGGHGEGLLMSGETVLRWRSLRG